jgi:hypothetical protein
MVSKIKPAKGVELEEILIGNIPAEKYSYTLKDSKKSCSTVILYLPVEDISWVLIKHTEHL